MIAEIQDRKDKNERYANFAAFRKAIEDSMKEYWGGQPSTYTTTGEYILSGEDNPPMINGVPQDPYVCIDNPLGEIFKSDLLEDQQYIKIGNNYTYRHTTFIKITARIGNRLHSGFRNKPACTRVSGKVSDCIKSLGGSCTYESLIPNTNDCIYAKHSVALDNINDDTGYYIGNSITGGYGVKSRPTGTTTIPLGRWFQAEGEGRKNYVIGPVTGNDENETANVRIRLLIANANHKMGCVQLYITKYKESKDDVTWVTQSTNPFTSDINSIENTLNNANWTIGTINTATTTAHPTFPAHLGGLDDLNNSLRLQPGPNLDATIKSIMPKTGNPRTSHILLPKKTLTTGRMMYGGIFYPASRFCDDAGCDCKKPNWPQPNPNRDTYLSCFNKGGQNDGYTTEYGEVFEYQEDNVPVGTVFGLVGEVVGKGGHLPTLLRVKLLEVDGLGVNKVWSLDLSKPILNFIDNVSPISNPE